MNDRDRLMVSKITERITNIEKSDIKTHYALQRILSILEDDSKSNSKGLISNINELREDVENLKYINKNIRKVSIFFLSIISGLATFAAKMIFFGSE